MDLNPDMVEAVMENANPDHTHPVPGAGLSIPPCLAAINTKGSPLVRVLADAKLGWNAPEVACSDRL